MRVRIDGSAYDLTHELGQGSYGSVFAGHKAGLPKSRFAIKVFSESEDGDAATDAEAEGRWHSLQVRHGLTPVSSALAFSSPDLDRGRYAVLSLLGGKTLDDHPPMTVDQAAGIMAELGVACHDAHRQGVVHSDIKPENVVRTRKSGWALIDWGNAQRVGEQDNGVTTLGYMPPEAALAASIRVPVTAQRDTYSIGCLGYNVITKRDPQPHLKDPENLTLEEVKQPLNLKTGDARFDRLLAHSTESDPRLRSGVLDLLVDLTRYESARDAMPADIQQAVAQRFVERSKAATPIRDGTFEVVTRLSVLKLDGIEAATRKQVLAVDIDVSQQAWVPRQGATPIRSKDQDQALMQSRGLIR